MITNVLRRNNSVVLRRLSAIHCQHRCSSSSGAPLSDDEILQSSNWRSDDLRDRLGITKDMFVDVQVLKRHYRVLAKHYHPDSQGSPNDGAEAFRRVQEAYETLSKNTQQSGSEGSGGASHSNTSSGFTESDDFLKRRRQIRFLGEGIGIFMLGCLIYIFVVARHNKQRLGSFHFAELIGIFVVLQLFPRILAAAVIFSYYSTSLLQIAELTFQAQCSLIVEKLPHQNSCRLTVEGFTDCDWNAMSIMVRVDAPNATTAAKPQQVLTFDRGVRSVLIPIPSDPALANNLLYTVEVIRCDNSRLCVTKKAIHI